MVLQHSSVGKSLLWHISLLNAKVGTFPLSYAVIPSFISCFTTFCCIHCISALEVGQMTREIRVTFLLGQAGLIREINYPDVTRIIN